MNRRLLASAGPLLAALLLSGHVGSPNIYFEGNAGPYPVRITVRPPEVIPGRAEIVVRTAGGGARRVTVRPVRWDLGLEGAPRPDEARPVEGEPNLWSAELWLMEFGSYSVHVAVEGARGTGRVIVPVPATATRIRPMPAGLGVALLGLGLFLLVGAFTLVGAAVREAVLPPGERPDAARVRRSWIARGVAAPVFALALLIGARWWGGEDERYAEHLYRPPEVSTRVEAAGADRLLTLTIGEWASPGAGDWSPLLPDHGKLMHMFLVRQPGLDVFAHVHPTRRDSASFQVALPPLPAGDYRLYADVVHENGLSQTLTDTVALPTGVTAAPAPVAPDDSWLLGRPSRTGTFRLADGSTMRWERPRGALVAGRELTLRFRVLDPRGEPARLAPYLGMLGHAAVTRDDGSVFVHLHPMGSVSMAAQRSFEHRARAGTGRAGGGAPPPPHAAHEGGGAGVVEFPFAFPRPGRFQIWIQVRRGGQVLTGAFETTIKNERMPTGPPRRRGASASFYIFHSSFFIRPTRSWHTPCTPPLHRSPPDCHAEPDPQIPPADAARAAGSGCARGAPPLRGSPHRAEPARLRLDRSGARGDGAGALGA